VIATDMTINFIEPRSNHGALLFSLLAAVSKSKCLFSTKKKKYKCVETFVIWVCKSSVIPRVRLNPFFRDYKVDKISSDPLIYDATIISALEDQSLANTKMHHYRVFVRT